MPKGVTAKFVVLNAAMACLCCKKASRFQKRDERAIRYHSLEAAGLAQSSSGNVDRIGKVTKAVTVQVLIRASKRSRLMLGQDRL